MNATGHSPLAPAAGTPLPPGTRIVVIGGGMTGHRFAARMQSQDPTGDWTLTVIGEETQQPYDRVHLSDWFGHRRAEMLALDTGVWADPRITLVTGDAAESLDRSAHTITCASGTVHEYDRLVLATGSWAWAPRAEGKDLPGSFSYRTVDDVESLAAWVAERGEALGREVRGVVVGGGVLGLEAAAALQDLGARSTVVEFADRLMAVQLDDGGGEMLRLLIQDKGIEVRTGVGATAFRPAADGAMGTAELTDGSELPADVVVFSTGIRPRDRIGREAGLAVGERGGIVVGESCQTSDPDIWAIGECASFDGVCAGLIAPGNDMADVVADRFLGGTRTHQRGEDGTKLKGVGVDAAAFGDVNAMTPDALEVSFVDPVHRQYRKLVMSDDATTLLGGVFVGDIALYSQLRPMTGRALSADPSAVIAPEGGGDALAGAEMPDDAVICSCNNVSAGTVRHAVNEQGCHTIGAIKECTTAGTVCGSCVPSLTKLLNQELAKSGIEVSRALCEHFDHSRAELYRLVEEGGQETFTEVVAAHGTGAGRGCAVCRPTVASILSSLGALSGKRHSPVGRQLGSLQDTNDHVMANIQKDGTYSVIPAMPAGEVTPEKLLVFAQVAKDYGLYVKVNGAQRIGMFGARLEQLPEIWERLVEAGFESGHAYGKSLRMVKSCLGTNWCRYGVGDSTAMASHLERRYRGLRSPHKIKIGVSGCARECAEAQAKDVGVIATHRGWNLYVGGNGGAQPAHAQLLVEDLDDETLQRCIDRFLILYIREADKLQRTARWVEEYPGGIDELRRVIVEDSLGIGEELEAAMQRHTDTYVDEWAEAVHDPERRAKFVSFINAPDLHDKTLRYVLEREQVRPARPEDAPETTFPTPLAAKEHALAGAAHISQEDQ
ncbi:nitrite reductase large subunit NirB [Brachybacterium paraconglomeratum]|uniref:nitrite reductase large subunit NirB n=1 Tax=Brachybacterium paraconglomeratum TaxID=173362 RepID=UPI0021A52DE0|nr:nitrite reductase large subunit NirB [Brachybacterium paraconglomeratum]MCT1910601.1 nitrite reductase large subunit NirB [Brachybacterium paraconglomeratum]